MHHHRQLGKMKTPSKTVLKSFNIQHNLKMQSDNARSCFDPIAMKTLFHNEMSPNALGVLCNGRERGANVVMVGSVESVAAKC